MWHRLRSRFTESTGSNTNICLMSAAHRDRKVLYSPQSLVGTLVNSVRTEKVSSARRSLPCLLHFVAVTLLLPRLKSSVCSNSPGILGLPFSHVSVTEQLLCSHCSAPLLYQKPPSSKFTVTTKLPSHTCTAAKMGPETRVLFAWCAIVLLAASCHAMKFDNDFNVVWQTNNNILAQDSSKSVDLSLSKAGGANFESSQPYLYGSFSVRIKLVPGESAGTVAAFYLMSFSDNHDEIDFEFLGNETGEPYTLHTNIFVNGTGGREQRIKLWFDPTSDFHTYKVVWNHYQVLWLVDEIPIRFYRNLEKIYPGSFPQFQPLVVSACIFDGSLWATQDGTKPVLWDHAPFTVSFHNFQFEACAVPRGTDPRVCDEDYEGNWWEGLYYQSLDESRRDQLMWVTANYKIYDYCYDQKRYVPMPLECGYNVPWVWS